ADGVIGRQTSVAIRTVQQRNGLPVTGRATADVAGGTQARTVNLRLRARASRAVFSFSSSRPRRSRESRDRVQDVTGRSRLFAALRPG
ncbi:MAG: peptidoglycan-binding protein, partial [Bacteroidales bacterium]|nr:peptidoglycan-binding protein [Bacteroidales bacterium]